MPLSFPPLKEITVDNPFLYVRGYTEELAVKGKEYRAYVKFTIPGGGTLDIRMEVTDYAVRFGRLIDLSRGDITYTSYVNSVLSDGTPVTTVSNLNDQFPLAPNIQFYTAPTVTTIGPESDYLALRTDTQTIQRASSTSSGNEPLRFYSPKTFLLRIVNRDANQAEGVFRFHFGNLT